MGEKTIKCVDELKYFGFMLQMNSGCDEDMKQWIERGQIK